MQLNKRLDNFELKLRQLASKFERQEQEKETLSRENRELKKELDRQRGVVSALREKLTQTGSTDLSAADAADKMPAAVRNRINECIREIDVCIEWLENH